VRARGGCGRHDRSFVESDPAQALATGPPRFGTGPPPAACLDSIFTRLGHNRGDERLGRRHDKDAAAAAAGRGSSSKSNAPARGGKGRGGRDEGQEGENRGLLHGDRSIFFCFQGSVAGAATRQGEGFTARGVLTVISPWLRMWLSIHARHVRHSSLLECGTHSQVAQRAKPVINFPHSEVTSAAFCTISRFFALQ
jgi:hypothetical protein